MLEKDNQNPLHILIVKKSKFEIGYGFLYCPVVIFCRVGTSTVSVKKKALFSLFCAKIWYGFFGKMNGKFVQCVSKGKISTRTDEKFRSEIHI